MCVNFFLRKLACMYELIDDIFFKKKRTLNCWAEPSIDSSAWLISPPSLFWGSHLVFLPALFRSPPTLSLLSFLLSFFSHFSTVSLAAHVGRRPPHDGMDQFLDTGLGLKQSSQWIEPLSMFFLSRALPICVGSQSSTNESPH